MLMSMEGFRTEEMAAFVALVVMFVVTLAIVVKVRRNGKSKLPPGPRPLPVIGNVHQMGGLPHQTLWHLAEKFGPIMHMRMGSIPWVIVSTAEAAEQFIRVQDKAWASRPQRLADKIFTNNFRDIVMAPYGQHWRHMRKICTLELFTHKRIESFRTYRTEEFGIMVRSVYEDSVAGRPADLTVKMGHLATNTITRMLVGKRYRITPHTLPFPLFQNYISFP